MRYHYFYQSRENKTCDDWIEAKNRDDAYALLRKRGIKPFKVLGRNPYAWKRWTAIGVLAALVAVLALLVMRGVAKNRREAYEAAHAQAAQNTENVGEGAVESEDIIKDSEKAEEVPTSEEEKLNETAENDESEDNK